MNTLSTKKGTPSDLPDHTTLNVIRGSLLVVSFLTALMLIYDLANAGEMQPRTLIFSTAIIYLLFTQQVFNKGRIQLASWLVVALYQIFALSALLDGGVNAPQGVLAAGFACILPGILVGSRYILPMSALALATVISVHTTHSTGRLSPDPTVFSISSTFWDVATYTAIISIFALVSWLSSSHFERNVSKLRRADQRLRLQKEILQIELDKQLFKLRQAQLEEVRHLHRFALVGQMTAATIHDLSTHLSILNFDLSDIKQQHKNSKAIRSAEESIGNINKMIRDVRARLLTQSKWGDLDIKATVKQSIHDLKDKYKGRNVTLRQDLRHSNYIPSIKGNQMALVQIVTILLNNALEATSGQPDPQVTVSVICNDNKITLTVKDNCLGVSEDLRNHLFTPLTSSKPDGLGVGLYIAKSLAQDQLNGTLELKDSKKGACFALTIPITGAGVNQLARQ